MVFCLGPVYHSGSIPALSFHLCRFGAVALRFDPPRGVEMQLGGDNMDVEGNSMLRIENIPDEA